MTKKPITAQAGIISDYEKQYLRLVEDVARQALKEFGLDQDGMRKLSDNWDKFQSRIMAAILECSVSSQFADEETTSIHGYPEGYKPKDIAEQVQILRSLFPELEGATYDKNIATQPLPAGAEGWFAIARYQTQGLYSMAVDRVLTTIASKQRPYNYHKGLIGSRYLRQHAKTAEAFRQIEQEQDGHDILVVPCQFGLRHRTRSVRRARVVMNTMEFGLGAFAVGCMILTHPEREVQLEQLHVSCAGDEFAPVANGDFSYAPFCAYDTGVKFGSWDVSIANMLFGSASGFRVARQ